MAARALIENVEGPLSIPFHATSMTWFDKIEEITFVSNTAAYFRPSSKTFPSIDAIYWDGEKLYLLQMTLNTKHPIVNAAVENILEWADSRNCCLVFVVPPA